MSLTESNRPRGADHGPDDVHRDDQHDAGGDREQERGLHHRPRVEPGQPEPGLAGPARRARLSAWSRLPAAARVRLREVGCGRWPSTDRDHRGRRPVAGPAYGAQGLARSRLSTGIFTIHRLQPAARSCARRSLRSRLSPDTRAVGVRLDRAGGRCRSGSRSGRRAGRHRAAAAGSHRPPERGCPRWPRWHAEPSGTAAVDPTGVHRSCAAASSCRRPAAGRPRTPTTRSAASLSVSSAAASSRPVSFAGEVAPSLLERLLRPRRHRLPDGRPPPRSVRRPAARRRARPRRRGRRRRRSTVSARLSVRLRGPVRRAPVRSPRRELPEPSSRSIAEPVGRRGCCDPLAGDGEPADTARGSPGSVVPYSSRSSPLLELCGLVGAIRTPGRPSSARSASWSAWVGPA